MNRYNIFNQVHKGLRTALYETAASLQQTDFLNPQDVARTFEKIEEVIDLFHHHAHTEDHIVLPVLLQYEPSVVLAFEDEHVKDHALAQRLKELMFVYNHSVEDETRIQTGRTLNIAFVEMVIYNLGHMAREEDIVNKLLWRYFTDIELKQLTQKIVSQVSPAVMAKNTRWMMRALNNQELINWLREVRDHAPDFVFESLMTTAQNELAADRWQEVREEVTNQVALVY
jgi:hypothetical protein